MVPPVMIDTLHYAKKLETAGVTPQHAAIQAETLAEVLEDAHKNLATKSDLDVLRLEVRNDVKELRADMNVKFAEVYTTISNIKSELIKWVFAITVTVSFGQAAMILSVLKFWH